jgi:hypothetical protein
VLVVEPFRRLAGKISAELEAEGDRVLGFTDDDADVREVRFAPPE